MIITPNQLQEIQRILDTNFSFFVGATMGEDFLSDEDKKRLKSIGVDIEKVYSPSRDFVLNNFHLGALSEFIGENAAKEITFKDLQNYMKAGKFLPLTSKEVKIVNSIKFQSLKDIRSTSSRIFSDVNGLISKENFGQRDAYEKIVRDTIIEGNENRKSVKQIISDLANLTGDYSRNFTKSVAYISHKALSEGKASMIEEKYGKDANVYVVVYADACKHCKRIYLKDGESIIFKLSELVANGSNIGRKANDWKAVIPGAHIHCRCHLRDHADQDVPKVDRPKIKVEFNGKTYYS